eukprot:gene9839-7725_t
MGNALTASEEVKQQQEKAKVAEARKKACIPAYDEDPDERIQRLVKEAVAHAAVTDRIVLDDLQPVPQPVKAAIVLSYLSHKKNAFAALMALYWSARAAHKVFRRNTKMQGQLMGKMDESTTVEPGGLVRRFAVEGRLYPKAEEETTNIFPSMFAKTTVAEDPGLYPLYRKFATIQELKCLMQQGVEETPTYFAYISKGQLTSYEDEVRLGSNYEFPYAMSCRGNNDFSW